MSKPALSVCLSAANVRFETYWNVRLLPEDRQGTAVTDTRIPRRTEDRDPVLAILLIGVWNTELLAQLVAGLHVRLSELEIEVVIAGARVEHHAR